MHNIVVITTRQKKESKNRLPHQTTLANIHLHVIVSTALRR